MGTASRLCSLLKRRRSLVMGPTGTPTRFPKMKRSLAGGGLGNAVLFSIAKAMRERNTTSLFAGYKTARIVQARGNRKRDRQSYLGDGFGDEIQPQRVQDAHFRGNIVQAMIAYAEENCASKT